MCKKQDKKKEKQEVQNTLPLKSGVKNGPKISAVS